jgi:hypothetical protein
VAYQPKFKQMDQLAEYRRQQAERRRVVNGGEPTPNVVEPVKTPEPLRQSVQPQESPVKQPTEAHETKSSGKLVLKSTEEVLNDREKSVSDVLEISKDNSEKVKYKKKLAELEQEKVKKERLEKQKLIESMRAEFGKPQTKSNKPKTKTPENELTEDDTVYAQQDEEPLTPTSKPCVIQIRLIDGTVVKAKFQSEDKLTAITNYVIQHIEQLKLERRKTTKELDPELESYSDGIRLSTTFPKKKFDNRILGTTTIEDAQLYPQGYVIVERDDSEHGFKRKANEPFKSYVPVHYLEAVAPWRLKGDSHDEKEKFKAKMRDKEIEEKEKEKKQKKKQLEIIRLQMEEDKRIREEKRRKSSSSIEQPTTQPSTTSKVDEKTACVVQVRLKDGTVIAVSSLTAGDTLWQLRTVLLDQGNIKKEDNIMFIVPFPRKEYYLNVFKAFTLSDLGLAPKGTIIVQDVK